MRIEYHHIGFVRSPVRNQLRPEEIRVVESEVVIEPGHDLAVHELKTGDYIHLVYHLHQSMPPKHGRMVDWMKRRTKDRPNPIGITLVQVIDIKGLALTVIGLDAIDGTPVLDIKPFRPIFDLPPVAGENVDMKIRRAMIALTGGPGGGKSSLIEDLRKHPKWSDKFVCLPETAGLCRFSQISPGEKLFQRLMVQMQMSLEKGLDHSLGTTDPRVIICHRGSLDPLAFWLQRGWPEDEFFSFTGLSRSEHYQRYTCVIHLVTSAIDVSEKYTRWPHAHRPEEPEEATKLDQSLEQAWGDHPRYYKIDNRDKDWESKSKAAIGIIEKHIGGFSNSGHIG